MQLTFWGVRGSIPTPGLDATKWGGNSSCVEVRHGDLPPLVLDAGTGLRLLGHRLMGDPGRFLNLVFSHFHIDHVLGFPFFLPAYTPDFTIRITIPAYSEAEARQKLTGFMGGVYHPVRLSELPATLRFSAIRPGHTFERDGFKLRGLGLNHPGGATGYRIRVDGQSMAYMTDTAPFAKPGVGLLAGKAVPRREQRVIDFLRGIHTVVYDTMYDYQEYLGKRTWGHSYPAYAHALCRAAGVRRLVLFHHSPDATDADLDARAAKWATAIDPVVMLAREGDTLTL